MLSEHGHVRMVSTSYKRYVGAQIGIYNPSGEKVGKARHLSNREQIFVVSPDHRTVERAERAIRSALV